MLLAGAISPGAWAQTAPSVVTEPAIDGPLPPAPGGGSWVVDVGVGTFVAPAFLGSRDYQLLGGPVVSVRYKDRVFVSANGIGADLVGGRAISAGPIVKLQMARFETNGNALRLAGGRSDALRGLGDVGFTPEAGGFVDYRYERWSARVELRKGLGGHDGAIGDVSLRYMLPLTTPAPDKPPALVSIGVRASVVDDTYNAAYFGVTAAQSTASGLRRYTAGGGLLSAGANAGLILPLSYRLSASLLASYDRMAGDAARSPLVEERGSRDQVAVGLGFSYRFGR